MSYPTSIPVSALEAVERAKRIAASYSKYILGAGGRNPQAETPFTSKNGALGSDCIGFVLWCWGLDRLQSDYPFYEGWINTDSMLMDVAKDKTRFEEIFRPYPGCCVVYKSKWSNGKMIRMGHIGLVVAAPENWPHNWKSLPLKERLAWCKKVTVIDCAAAASRKLVSRAVGTRTAEIWAEDGSFVRYKNQAAPSVQDTHTPEEIMISPKLGSRWLKLYKPLMRGQDVIELQKLLGITTDGIFGMETESFVRQFQRKNGLFEDGVVGPATLAKLGVIVGV